MINIKNFIEEEKILIIKEKNFLIGTCTFKKNRDQLNLFKISINKKIRN